MMELILTHLLAEMSVIPERTGANLERMEAKMGADIKTFREKANSNREMEENVYDGREEMKARVGCLASRIDVKQEEMKAIQYKMKITMKSSNEETEAAIHCIRSELEKTLKHLVEDVLACVDPRVQDLCKELNEKIDETQVDLKAVKTSNHT
jgi:hypothetical protein